MASFDEWVSGRARFPYGRLVSPDGDKLVPDEPGLYLWGATCQLGKGLTDVPRYVGRATGSLRRRFVDYRARWSGPVGRYVPTVNSGQSAHPPQGWLATEYGEMIRNAAGSGDCIAPMRAWAGMRDAYLRIVRQAFPKKLVSNFADGLPGQTRLWHAVDWALHGGKNLERLWVAFYPDSADSSDIKELEKQMIYRAAQWNYGRGLMALLNKNHAAPWNAYER